MGHIKQYAGYIFDLDGTLYLGDRLIAGADYVVAALRDRGAKVMFVTNKPISTPEAYAAKLTKLGISADIDDVLTSPVALADYIRVNHTTARVLALGEEPVMTALEAVGCELVSSASDAEIVVISWDRKVTYARLDEAYQALRNGAKFYVTNPDVTCPLENGAVSDAGAVVAYMTAASGRVPDHVAGKPFPALAMAAMDRMGVTPETTILTGDRLQTDLMCGKNAGCATAVVLTGVSSRADVDCLPAAQKPDYILNSVSELVE